ncbi:response regulator [Geobacter sp. SVR]|uniref:response regulator n=1 Tax=Geobacter sp. SVR TaxID=2495594 RepID=UPI00143F0321|nr:response regulator [Geobacter sp. SVR]BCS55738.1 response regulator [Geobacter sp. SVR]GCF83742.1 response regulator [Geobacter sp. SVR]
MAQSKRILLVEDNPHDAELAMEALARHGLANTVDHVKSGEDALDYLYRRGSYAGGDIRNLAVVMLDLNLPRMGGLEVLRTIKSDQHLKGIPVVVLTSSREERDMVESYRLGVNSYVVKPASFQDFANAVKELGIFWAVTNEPPPVHRKDRP